MKRAAVLGSREDAADCTEESWRLDLSRFQSGSLLPSRGFPFPCSEPGFTGCRGCLEPIGVAAILTLSCTLMKFLQKYIDLVDFSTRC